MKLVFLYPNLTEKAGTERVIIDKANYLAEHTDYEIIIITYEHGSHPIAYPISSKIKHIDLNICFYQLYNYNRIIRFFGKKRKKNLLQKKYNETIKHFQPNIVTTVTYYRDALEIVAKCPYSYTKILESHVDKNFLLINDPTNGRDIFTRLRLYYEMKGVEYYSKKFDLLVALNQHDAKNWSKNLNTTIITNMVNINKRAEHSSLKEKRVIFAGRYAKEKGLLELFKIWTLVYQKHPDWHLCLYGQGPMHNTLINEAKRLNANITVNAPSENIFEEYRNSTIFVLCSVFETFGLVIPEAMSCGLPVVSFDCPFGPRHIISDGKDGFLIPNRDIQAFSDCICNLIESEQLRHKIGQEAIMSAYRYSEEKIIPQWVELYEGLLNKKE